MRKPEKKDECIVILSSDEDEDNQNHVYVKVEQPMPAAMMEVEQQRQERRDAAVESEEEISTVWVQYEDSSNSYDYEYSCEICDNGCQIEPRMHAQEARASPEMIQEQRQSEPVTPIRVQTLVKVEASPSQSAKRALL